MTLEEAIARAAPFMKYDLSTWPYVVMVAQPGEPTPDAFQAHLDVFRHLLYHGQAFSILIHTSQGRLANMQLVSHQARFLQEHRQAIVQNLVCSSIVVTSTFIHTVLSALFCIVRPQKPCKTFTDLEAASQWTMQRWAYSGLVATDSHPPDPHHRSPMHLCNA